MEKTNNSIWNRGFTCAFFANLLLCLSQNTANTLISTYASYLGAGAVLVGAISGLYFGVAFAARPISGPVITLLDKRKIMIATYIAGVVTNVAYAWRAACLSSSWPGSSTAWNLPSWAP